jgi:acyl dehydratase
MPRGPWESSARMPLDMTQVGRPCDARSFSYTWKDAVLYALGVGAKRDELDWLYERRGPKVLPSFVVVPMFEPMLECIVKTGGDLSMVVHGKQSVRMHAELPPAATLSTVAKLRGIYDMRRFAVLVVDCEVRKDSGELLAETSSQIIIRGAGGFGGETPPKEPKVVEAPKAEAPHFAIEERTSFEQALLYRLSGDINPLHVDPAFAASVGFEAGPILHGLCTFGHMVRHVAKGACGGDASKLTAFEAKFSKPVWPGDTLVTQGWTVAPGQHALSVKVKERDEVVCGGSWALSAV